MYDLAKQVAGKSKFLNKKVNYASDGNKWQGVIVDYIKMTIRQKFNLCICFN